MADLTMTQRFGSSVSFNETSKILSIDLNNFTDAGDVTTGLGLDVSSMTTANIDSYSSKILWAIIQLSQQNQAVDNNDETVGLYVTNQGKRNVTRNSVAQIAFQLVANAYINDPIAVNLDPDAIGS